MQLTSHFCNFKKYCDFSPHHLQALIPLSAQIVISPTKYQRLLNFCFWPWELDFLRDDPIIDIHYTHVPLMPCGILTKSVWALSLLSGWLIVAFFLTNHQISGSTFRVVHCPYLWVVWTEKSFLYKSCVVPFYLRFLIPFAAYIYSLTMFMTKVKRLSSESCCKRYNGK